MPAAPRPNKKGMRIVYKLLKTPKDQQQDKKQPSEKVKKEWFSDLANAQ